MSRSNFIKQLFELYALADDEGFRQVAENLIEAERKRGNHLYAEDLRALLIRRNGHSKQSLKGPSLTSLSLPTQDRDNSPLISVRLPRISLADVVLQSEALGRLHRVLDELRNRDRLQSINIPPARKLLFYGPPGCGKTASAEAMAAELGLPFAAARIDSVVSSYLGETSSNLRRVFDFAQSTPCVLLLDEFDSIGKSRDDPHEVGELKRVVNSFLEMLDSYSGDGIIIAATNHEGLLDTALWRRFDEVVHFSRPTSLEIVTLLNLLLRGIPKTTITPSKLSKAFNGMSHAEVCEVVKTAIKTMVLSNRESLDNSQILAALKLHRSRRKLGRGRRSSKK